jgi:hypothetical protein
MKAAPQEQTQRKTVLKVAVGGPTYSRPELCYTYLIELPGVFQRIGNSENPGKLKEQLELDFGAPLILAQVRAFPRSRRRHVLREETAQQVRAAPNSPESLCQGWLEELLLPRRGNPTMKPTGDETQGEWVAAED